MYLYKNKNKKTKQNKKIFLFCVFFINCFSFLFFYELTSFHVISFHFFIYFFIMSRHNKEINKEIYDIINLVRKF